MDYLTRENEDVIRRQLNEAGYERGNYTLTFAEKLMGIAEMTSQPPFNGDVSNIFNQYEANQHNRETIRRIIRDLQRLPGVGQKVSTMFAKFMI